MMKRRVLTLTALAALLLSLLVPALAIEYGRIYDGTNLLDAGEYSLQVEEMVGEISEELDFEIRVDVVEDLEGYSIEEYAAIFYDQYEYGMGASGQDGSLLMIYAPLVGNSLRFEAFTIHYGGLGRDYFLNNRDLNDESVLMMMEDYLNVEAWSDLENAQENFWEAVTTYAFTVSYIVNDYRDSGEPQPTAASPATAAPPAVVAPPAAVAASENTLRNVVDEAKLLTGAQAERLDKWAHEISEQYQCAVIVLTMADFGRGDWFETAMRIYAERGFGYGEDDRGVMLLLSMAERDAVLYVEGSAQEAFQEGYGQESLEANYLEFLRKNDFNGAFEQFIYDCAVYMELAVQGTPITNRDDPGRRAVGTVVSIVVPLLVAAIFCLIQRQRMKTAKIQRSATQYVTKEGLDLTLKRDDYLYATETRTKIETKSSGGSSSSSSHSSGRSSKF